MSLDCFVTYVPDRSDVERWIARSDLYVLLTHEKGMRLKAIPEAQMQREYPKAWRYLKRFEGSLRKSGVFRRYFKPTDPFYSMFNIGDYTFSPHKVLIREIASSLTCAVVGARDGKPCVPDHKLVMVGCDTAEQAHFLCAVLNSSPARLLVESYSIDTQFSTHIFNLLAIPAFLANNKTHSRLSILSREAHRAAGAADSGKLKSLEGEIDDLVVGFWGLTESDLQEIRYALEES